MPGAPNGAVFRETIDTVERHARWATLEAQGWTRARIAATEGVARSTVKRGIEDLLAAVKVAAADELRAHSRERLRLILERLFDELDKPHPLVRDGQRYDDLTDIGSVVALLREVRATDESLRKLDGLDAPTRRIVEVIGEDAVDRAIAALEAEMAEREAADATRDGPGSRSAVGEAAPAP
jgi:hypothetical protein